MTSEYYLNLHKEYLRQLRLKYSILLKSEPALVGTEVCDIRRMRIDREIRNEAEQLLSQIRLHELYFDSFSTTPINPASNSASMQRQVNEVLYNIKNSCMKLQHGFLTVGIYRGELSIISSADYYEHFVIGRPILALDLCEHAYFGDWGFNKEGYLDDACPRLLINRVFDALR